MSKQKITTEISNKLAAPFSLFSCYESCLYYMYIMYKSFLLVSYDDTPYIV